MRPIQRLDWGLIDYESAAGKQEALRDKLLHFKEKNTAAYPCDYFIFCEHPPVYTLGRSGRRQHLLLNESELQQKGVSFFYSARGGDITFHGPGQIVAYPIIDLEARKADLIAYIRLIEQGIIDVLQKLYDLRAERSDGATGVWIDSAYPEKARKICAIGIHCRRWVTLHGFALNVHTDLDYFQGIIPCGIADKKVTSLTRELGKKVDINTLKNHLFKHFQQLLHQFK